VAEALRERIDRLPEHVLQMHSSTTRRIASRRPSPRSRAFRRRTEEGQHGHFRIGRRGFRKIADARFTSIGFFLHVQAATETLPRSEE